MTAQSFLQYLAARGVILSADGDQLDIDAPDGVLTDELLSTLRERKAELLDLLPSGHLCPGCAGALRLQDQARDAWW